MLPQGRGLLQCPDWQRCASGCLLEPRPCSGGQGRSQLKSLKPSAHFTALQLLQPHSRALLAFGPRALAGLAVGKPCRCFLCSGACGGCSHQCILGTCSGLAALTSWQRAQRRFYWCASRHLRVLPDLDVTWRTACACALRARRAGYQTQPCLLHVPRPICMQNMLVSPSVLACSAFLHEQMCSFSCPLHIPCPIHCPVPQCVQALFFCFFFFPWPLLCPQLMSQWHFRTLVNRTV